ncbi:MAG: helix-turn-helix transcriptional regulator [Clostridia bacterium]|nr:helix-turn-helix transcriptional regulator [Clostridia bacterium]
MIYIGENIRKLRRENDVTQEMLADHLGVTFQSVSKWERGETYPDITMLPAIASFFNVSCDELLGTQAAENEKRILSYIDTYTDLRTKDSPYVFEQLAKAVKEFPGEYRLLVRYLELLLMEKSGAGNDSEAIIDEVERLYSSIISRCTDDMIRMWAKRLVCMYYNTLSHKTKKDCHTQRMLEILHGMPNMLDTREYISTLVNLPEDEHYEACFKALDREMLLLMSTVSNKIFYRNHFPPEYQIQALESCKSIADAFYSDGNYGSCYRSMIYLLGNLGQLYGATGDGETALKYLKECAALAQKHDSLPEETEHNGIFMQGSTYKKAKYGKTMCERMKRIFLNDYQQSPYPLPQELLNSEEFKEILDILN